MRARRAKQEWSVLYGCQERERTHQEEACEVARHLPDPGRWAQPPVPRIW